MMKLPGIRYLLFVLCFFAAETASGQRLRILQEGQHLEGRIINQINIVGQRYTKEYVIRRELTSTVGEPFLLSNVIVDYRRLERLGIFSLIDFKAHEVGEEIDLEVHVEDTFPFLPSVNFQITDANGLSIGGGLTAINLFGKDVAMDLLALFGGATTIQLMLHNPWMAGNHFSYILEFYQRNRENELGGFQEVSTEGTLTLASYLADRGRIGGKVGFISIGSDMAGGTLSPDLRDNVMSVEFFIGYDSRDLWFDTRRGWWNQVTLSRSGLLSDSDFWRLNLDIRRYFPIFDRQTLAVFSLTTLTTGELDRDIAPWQQLGLGGTNTIRGWELNTQVGKNQFINTVEYRYTLKRPTPVGLFGMSIPLGIQLAAFGDFGMAWSSGDEFKADNFIGGYGVGIRLLQPFSSMFRIDFGLGQSGKSVMLGFGSFEKPVRQLDRVR